MDIDMNDIFIFSGKCICENALKIRCGCLVAVAAVINSLGIFVLTCEKSIGNDVSSGGQGFLGEAEIKSCLMPKGISHLTLGLKEIFNYRILLV